MGDPGPENEIRELRKYTYISPISQLQEGRAMTRGADQDFHSTARVPGENTSGQAADPSSSRRRLGRLEGPPRNSEDHVGMRSERRCARLRSSVLVLFFTALDQSVLL